MKRLPICFTLLFFLSFCFKTYSQQTNTNVVAKIKTETTDNSVKIVATSSNTTEVFYSLRYVLSVIKPKENPEQTDKYSQEERFTLQPTETKNLTETAFPIAKDERVIVLLLIYDDENKLVGKDRIVFNDVTETKEKQVEKPKDGIELRGIVSDETKTKIGKDFYDYFYRYYTNFNINGEKIVTVEEIVSFRRNTFIKVRVDDTIIFEFFSNPSDEFLENASKTAIQRVYRYFEKLKKENAYITQY